MLREEWRWRRAELRAVSGAGSQYLRRLEAGAAPSAHGRALGGSRRGRSSRLAKVWSGRHAGARARATLNAPLTAWMLAM